MMLDAERYAHLGELLQDALRTYKSDLALLEYRRDRESARFTYLDVKAQVEALTGWLEAQGIGASDRVAVLMSNQSSWLVTACAVFARGAVLVPLDYKLDPATQGALLTHSGAKLLVTEYGFARRLGDALSLPTLLTDAPETHAATQTAWETALGHAPLRKLLSRKRDDTACIVYSSGTSGRPKGCMLSHGAYLAQYASLSELYPMERGDRYFSILPTNHAIDFMCGFIGPFAGGATVVHQRTLRPEFVRTTMAQAGITHMAVVPLLLEAFERTLNEKLAELPAWARRAFAAVERGAALLEPSLASMGWRRLLFAKVQQAFGGRIKLMFAGGAYVDARRAARLTNLGLPVVIGYGLTEACTVVTVNDLRPYRADTVGVPVAGVELEVRGDEGADFGEIWLRSATLMQGYLDDPELTRQSLVDGWLRTGDMGRLDRDGHLQLIGRRKNMIVTPGGKNIYPEDVETALEIPEVEELAVYSSNYLWPELTLGAEQLVAVVRSDKAELLDTLRASNRCLPEHKRLAAVLPWSEPFPRTASMKLKREALADTIRSQSKPDALVQLAA